VKALASFVERMLALLITIGSALAWRMFGRRGIRLHDAIFTINASGRLYLKTGLESGSKFAEAVIAPFTYRRQGREKSMSYWSASDCAIDDMMALQTRADLTLVAVQRA